MSGNIPSVDGPSVASVGENLSGCYETMAGSGYRSLLRTSGFCYYQFSWERCGGGGDIVDHELCPLTTIPT